MSLPAPRPSRRDLFRLGALGTAGGLTAVLTAPAVLPALAQPTGSPSARTSLRYLDLESRRASRSSRTTETGVLAELSSPRVAAFSTLAVTWAGGQDGPTPRVTYRVRRDGRWSSWADLGDGAAGEAEAAALGNGRDGTDPVFVGDCDRAEVRVLGGADTTVVEPQLVLIDSPRLAADTAAAEPTFRTAADPGRPDLSWRGGWGADESLGGSCRGPNRTLQAAIIHHTAGSNSYAQADSARIVRGIHAYHTNTLGWCDIGYNFLIDKWGRIFEGRDGSVESNAHGAHASSWNTDTVGISFMGNYEDAAATSAMMESAARVAAWKLAPYDRDPRGRVTLAGKTIFRVAGHRDVMATACPGRNVVARMPALRDRTAALIG